MYRCGVASAQRVSVLLSVFDCLFATNEQKGACIGAWGFEAMSGIEVGTRKILGYRSVSSHGVLICRRPLSFVSRICFANKSILSQDTVVAGSEL